MKKVEVKAKVDGGSTLEVRGLRFEGRARMLEAHGLRSEARELEGRGLRPAVRGESGASNLQPPTFFTPPTSAFPHLSRAVGMAILFVAVLMSGMLPNGTVAHGAPPDAPAVDPGYRLGPEDVMLISVWKDEQLTREVVVRPDGMFSFPLVGDIQAEDRTVEEIRGDLVKRLIKYIPNPNVSVSVMKVLSNKVYVVGRVNKPGEYLVGHYTDVLQALSLAGGLTPFAAENDIKVIRRVKGQQQVLPVRYGDLRKGQNLEQNVLLQRGDVVMVP